MIYLISGYHGRKSVKSAVPSATFTTMVSTSLFSIYHGTIFQEVNREAFSSIFYWSNSHYIVSHTSHKIESPFAHISDNPDFAHCPRG